VKHIVTVTERNAIVLLKILNKCAHCACLKTAYVTLVKKSQLNNIHEHIKRFLNLLVKITVNG
jgi:hypothetical protein